MPIFEYNCLDCNAEFEQLIMTADEEAVCCIACGSKNTSKKGLSNFSSPGIGDLGCGGGGCGGCKGSCH
jgi:putative FmdB family regulatory protein